MECSHVQRLAARAARAAWLRPVDEGGAKLIASEQWTHSRYEIVGTGWVHSRAYSRLHSLLHSLLCIAHCTLYIVLASEQLSP